MPFGRWFATQITASPLTDAYCITVFTDDVCHLWLRLSYIMPKQHPLSRRFRGLNIEGDVYYCFDAYSDIEQLQTGDTLIHTFQVPFNPSKSLAWFYLHGEVSGVPSPSTSPVYQIKEPGFSPIRNWIFSDWTPGDLYPLFWTMFYAGTGWSGWEKVTTDLPTPVSGIRMEAGGYDRITGVRQLLDATPYRFQRLRFRAWGKGIANTNTCLYIRIYADPETSYSDALTVPNVWQHKSIVATIPGDATGIRFEVRVYSPGYGPTFATWTYCTIELA